VSKTVLRHCHAEPERLWRNCRHFDNGLFDSLVEVDDNSIGSVALATYALSTAIGPLGTQPVSQANNSGVFTTSRGGLTVNRLASVTFQATTSAAATPIPSSILLCLAGIGAISLYAVARRRLEKREQACS